MADKKVKLKDQLGRVVRLDDGASGATLGKNLYGPDGKLLKASDIINPAPTSGNAVATIWRLIREIPANIKAVAALIGKGFAARQEDGEWALRTLQPGTAVDITNGDGEDGDPTIGLTPAAVASLALADTALQQVQAGSNVSVDNTDPKRPILSADVSGSGLYPILTDQLGNPLTDQLGRQLYSNVPALNILQPMTLAAANALTGVSDFQMVAITDLAGGREPCWYDATVASGTKWRRFSDRSIATL